MKYTGILGMVLVLVGACDRRDVILPGTREDIRPAVMVTEPLPTAITLPAAERITAWPTRAGSNRNTMPHAALSTAPVQIWSTGIGKGNSLRHRIVTDPVAADGRIFTMDSEATVTAVSQSGAVLWSRDLTPAFEKSGEASGGGLGLHEGVLYAATGYGNLHALDPATGAEAWLQRLDAPITAPTFGNGLVYLVSRDNRAWAVDLSNGRVRWELPASPSAAVLATAPAPVVSDRLVIFPFGSGELLGALPKTGIRVWGGAVAGSRRGVAYSTISDVAADPVVVGDTLYAATPAGRLVALNTYSGERKWTATEGALSPVLPVGEALFLVNDRSELLRLDAATGARVWSEPLPFYEANRLKRRKTAFAHFGPILAGSQVWVGSSDGALRAFDPETGAQTRSIDLRGGAATRPIVMNDTLYIVSAKGDLHAYR
jgi:outer membrane protein assembly factor BamB